MASHDETTVRELPTGTVTFVFTDIEGSTKLLDELGDQYADVLAEHRRALREAFTRHGGVEVDTQGDAFFFAFARASDAVAAAAEAQKALSDGPVRVRIGIHTGEPTRTDEGYVGIDVHRAARIAAAGHGGQVLVSQTTKELLGKSNSLLLDLGLQRLKDVGELRLFQAGGGAFPPLKTLNATNLPLPADPLVGRKKELADVLRLFREARLVTLTGPGGIGKTRFALEVAGELVEEFAHGVWFCDLSAVRDPALVLPTIAATLGAKGELADHVSDKELLLVLDNLEQVVEAAPELATLLERCPNLHAVATSREPLRIRGEREYPLRPLAEAPALELFRQRAEAARPDFEADYETLVEICERLDRLPLALELAAARTRLLSAEALRERLEQRLPLLAGGPRDLPERQRTLRATIEWSYELLSPEEQQLFRRLAVFAGGFTVEASEHVADADLETLESLVERSLVRREGDRFGMLGTIREFAAAALAEFDEADRFGRRHAEYFLGLAEESRRALRGPELSTSLARLFAEQDNLRSALDWAIGVRATEIAFPLVWALEVFWIRSARWDEAAEWADRALALDDPQRPALRARALATGGIFAQRVGQLETAAARFAASVPVLRSIDDREGLAFALRGFGWLLTERGALDEARAVVEEAVELFRELGHAVATRLIGLADIAFREGDLGSAARWLEEAVTVAESEGDLLGSAEAVLFQAELAVAAGDLEGAEEHFGRSIRLFPDHVHAASGAAGLSKVAVLGQRPGHAGTLWGLAERLAREAPSRLLDELARERDVILQRLGHDERATFERARQASSALSPDEAFEQLLAATAGMSRTQPP